MTSALLSVAVRSSLNSMFYEYCACFVFEVLDLAYLFAVMGV